MTLDTEHRLLLIRVAFATATELQFIPDRRDTPMAMFKDKDEDREPSPRPPQGPWPLPKVPNPDKSGGNGSDPKKK